MSQAGQFIIIGLGGNVGEREEYLRQAIDLIAPWVEQFKESCIYASPAMLPKDAPPEWDIPFLNMAISGYTELTPEQVLEKIKMIEERLGRTRLGHWGPREIDVDILAYDQLVVDQENLRIPHPGLLERAFVLLPVRDVAPHWVYPRPSIYEGRTVHEICRDILASNHQCKLYKTELSEVSA